MNILSQMLEMSEAMGGGQGFDPGTAIRQATALHGLLICVGAASYDEAISGQEVLIRAEAVIEEKFKELGIRTEKCFTDDP